MFAKHFPCWLAVTAAMAISAPGVLMTAALAQSGTERVAPPNPVARPAEINASTFTPAESDAADPFDLAPASPENTAPSIEVPAEPSFEIVVPDRDAVGVPVRFSAVLSEGGPQLQSDLVWTVYALTDGQIDDEDLFLSEQGGTLATTLPPGSYIVHVSYGMATLSRPLTISQQGLTETFDLNAGGVSLRGAISSEDFLPHEVVTFQIFPESVENFETAEPIARDIDERTILVVPAGRYTIVSRYGDVNAIVRAQIDVEAGQLTEAVMFHSAAQITLKLVNEPNGEALPNTAWSVLNPGGDIVREFVGAFPTMVLSEGDYTIIARHDGQVFSRDFAVVSGVNREEELVAQ